jgi:hypothetical protein
MLQKTKEGFLIFTSGKKGMGGIVVHIHQRKCKKINSCDAIVFIKNILSFIYIQILCVFASFLGI